MSTQYVWIFDNDDSVVGVWVSASLIAQPNMPEILLMAVVEKGDAAESVGKKGEDLGFGLDIFQTIAEKSWRNVPNGRTEMAKGNSFGGGAFLMFGNALSPNEVKDSNTAYQVRQAGESFGLIQLRPIFKKSDSLDNDGNEEMELMQLLDEAEEWGGRNNLPVVSEYPQYEKIQEVGQRLYDDGGKDNMVRVYNNISNYNRKHANILNFFWKFIGGWLP